MNDILSIENNKVPDPQKDHVANFIPMTLDKLNEMNLIKYCMPRTEDGLNSIINDTFVCGWHKGYHYGAFELLRIIKEQNPKLYCKVRSILVEDSLSKKFG